MLDLREKLKNSQDIALKWAEQAKTKSKTWYDKNARHRSFEPGQLVLVCLPIRGRPLEAKYCGPYRVMNKKGPVDYLIATQNRKKVGLQRVCHVNMLKEYVSRTDTESVDVSIGDKNIENNIDNEQGVLLADLK